MSKRVLFNKKGFVFNNAPCKNGIGRYIPQLQRLTIKFCKDSPSSLGIRHFIEADFVPFVKKNPHVAFYLKPRRHRSPVLVADYLNGERHWQNLLFYSPDEVKAWLDIYNSQSGKEYQYQEKWEYSDYPSIQGLWNGFTHENPEIAVAEFPNGKLSRPRNLEPSVTEQILEMFEQQQKSAV